jgi:hypothetical protein
VLFAAVHESGFVKVFGCRLPRAKISMMIMRPPQQGQGCSGDFGWR